MAIMGLTVCASALCEEAPYHFSQELLSNKLFSDTSVSFDDFTLRSMPEDTGVEMCENGDIILRVYAPEAGNVELRVGGQPLELAKDERGMWEGTLAYDPAKTGPQTVNVAVEGAVVLYPYFPVFWTSFMPINYVEVPDADMDFLLIKDNAHGAVIEEIYWSSAMNAYERLIVYTPPGYMKESTEEYPVLYLLHGSQDNEWSWVYTGRLAHIVDNLIAEDRIVPCIIVMPNCELDVEGLDEYHSIDKILMDDVMPYIEATYRVKTDKWNRAVAGLSMGAYAANDIGLWHPDFFGYIGQFTASMHHAIGVVEEGRAYTDSALLRDADAFAEQYRVFFRSTTQQENHFEYFEADDALCAEYGLDTLDCYHRTVYDENTTKWYSWRKAIRDFLPLLFQE